MLDRLRQLLLKVKTTNVPMAGFIIFLLYNMIAGPNVAGSIIFIAVTSLYGFRMLLDTKKVVDVNEELMKKINYLESSVNVLKVGSGFRTQDNNSDKSKRIF
jgi:hypothetical protein